MLIQVDGLRREENSIISLPFLTGIFIRILTLNAF